jgi:hypothetical protein
LLHLLPTRLLLTVFAIAVMTAYAVALRTGWVGAGTWVSIGLGIFKVATPAAIISMIAAQILWRWSPEFIQNVEFPYLGGTWDGEIEFKQDGVLKQHPATLEVVHTLTTIRFALSTAESTSQTVLVHARKVPVLKDVVKLVYIYDVERRENVPGAGDRYRGCAFLDVNLARPRAMTGTYMAGAGRTGAIRMELKTMTPFWKLWR